MGLYHWIIIVLLVHTSFYHAQNALDQFHYQFQCLHFPSVGKLPVHLQPAQPACYNFTLSLIPAALGCDKHEELFIEIELFCRQHLQYPISTQCAHYLIKQFRIAVAAESTTDFHSSDNNRSSRSVKVITLADSVDSHFNIYLNPYVHLDSALSTTGGSSDDTDTVDGQGQCGSSSNNNISSNEATKGQPVLTATSGLCPNEDDSSTSSSSSTTTPPPTPLTHMTRFTIITYPSTSTTTDESLPSSSPSSTTTATAISSSDTNDTKDTTIEVIEEFPALTEETLTWNAPSAGVGTYGNIGTSISYRIISSHPVISPYIHTKYHPLI